MTAPNGDAWSTVQSAIGGNISKPITGETTYTLRCKDLEGNTKSKTTRVSIIPVEEEVDYPNK